MPRVAISEDDYEYAVATAQQVCRQYLRSKATASWQDLYEIVQQFEFGEADRIEQFATDVLNGKHADDLAHAVLCEVARRKIIGHHSFEERAETMPPLDRYVCSILEKECESRLVPKNRARHRPPETERDYWIALSVALVLMQFPFLKPTRKQSHSPSACSIVHDAWSRSRALSIQEREVQDIWKAKRGQISFE
jgi:hypothetical protein